MQYGRIVNGVLFKAPHSFTHNGLNSDSHPAEVYLQYGYKPIQLTTPIEEIPYGKTIKMSWADMEDKIVQTWEVVAFEDDYAERLRKAKGHFNLTMLSLKECMDQYNQTKNSEAKAILDNSPVIKAAYDGLCAQFPDKTFVEIMSEYQKSVPFDFFGAIKFKDSLVSMGYTINDRNSKFVSLNPFVCYTESDIPDFQNCDGHVYYKDNETEVYIVPSYAAIRIVEDVNLEIIDPIFFCFGLKRVAETLESAYAPCTQFTMGVIYLHTILDEFINSIMNFYIHSFPKGCELSSPLSAADILGANDLSSLQEEIISKTISDFGYKGYHEKVEYLKKRGIECSLPKEKWIDDMVWFCERRNAVVHNSGIVNTTICDRLRKTKYQSIVHVSDDVRPSYSDFCNDYELVESVCNSLYDSVKEKFHL